MKKVSHWTPDIRVPKVLLSPPKNWIFGPKRAKFGPKLEFWPNIGIFCPFDLMPDQKTMRTSCLGGFSIIWVP